MQTITKAVGIAAGGLAIGIGLVLGTAYGTFIAIINDDPQEDV
jgi:hypothetical protein